MKTRSNIKTSKPISLNQMVDCKFKCPLFWVTFTVMICWSGEGGTLYRQAISLLESNPEKAFSFFQQSAEQGVVPSMVGMGHCHETGTGTSVDYNKALQWYLKAIDQNSLKACEAIARIYASCPDPKFHDGERALKYAEACLRKNPKNHQALSLLAAAQARNLEFSKAVKSCRMAKAYCNKDERLQIESRYHDYERGIPYPPVATKAWLLSASDCSPWAIIQLARLTSDPHSNYYDPPLAMEICQKGFDADIDGVTELHCIQAYLYLKEGALDKAYSHYCAAEDTYVPKRYEKGLPIVVYFRSDIHDPPDKILQGAAKFLVGRTGTSTQRRPRNQVPEITQQSRNVSIESCEGGPMCEGASCMDCVCIISSSSTSRPNADIAYFLYLIAASKGSESAKMKVANMEDSMFAYKDILESSSGKSNREISALFAKEAKKHTDNKLIPRNLNIAVKLYQKAFGFHASKETAYELGRIYLSNEYGHDGDQAVKWLEIAHSMGDRRVSNLLVEDYAMCRKAPQAGGRLALQCTEELLSKNPDDHKTIALTACVYARNGMYEDAQKSIDQALKMNSSRWYKKMKAKFKNKQPYTYAGWIHD